MSDIRDFIIIHKDFTSRSVSFGYTGYMFSYYFNYDISFLIGIISFHDFINNNDIKKEDKIYINNFIDKIIIENNHLEYALKTNIYKTGINNFCHVHFYKLRLKYFINFSKRIYLRKKMINLWNKFFYNQLNEDGLSRFSFLSFDNK